MLRQLLCLGIVFAPGTSELAFSQQEPAQESPSDLKSAWTHWKNGDVLQAEKSAGKLADSPESRHLLFLCAYVKGAYEDALAHFAKVDAAYARRGEMHEAVVHACLHLNRYKEARDFAQERKLAAPVLAKTELHARHPLKTHLNKVAVIAFAEHKLTPYFPAFDVELEGEKVVAHMDTGGTFLIMGPERAKKLKIELIDAGEGFHATKKVKMQQGVAKKLVLGDAVLENLHVVVMPTLTGPQDFIIFGTNVLQQFLSTLDYPNKRLILSPRHDKELRKKHLEMLPEKRTEVPFYMWGDHYMFARGGLGKRADFNFFIDSGLVSLGLSKTGLRQACFMATPELYQEWGVDPESAKLRHFESPLPISLGPLTQKDQFFATVAKPSWTSFGGVRIDGLLSHAFLNQYAWTLDFDERRYVFAEKADRLESPDKTDPGGYYLVFLPAFSKEPKLMARVATLPRSRPSSVALRASMTTAIVVSTTTSGGHRPSVNHRIAIGTARTLKPTSKPCHPDSLCSCGCALPTVSCTRAVRPVRIERNQRR